MESASLRALLQDTLKKELADASERIVTALSVASGLQFDGPSLATPEESSVIPGEVLVSRPVQKKVSKLSQMSSGTRTGVWQRKTYQVHEELDGMVTHTIMKNTGFYIEPDGGDYEAVVTTVTGAPHPDGISSSTMRSMVAVEVGEKEEADTPGRTRQPLMDDLPQDGVPRKAVIQAKERWWDIQEPTIDKFGGILILLNALFLSVETDYMARFWKSSVPKPFQVVDFIFCVLFSIELLLRLSKRGCGLFRMKGWQWNLFDVFVVLMQIFENGVKVCSKTMMGQLKGGTGILRIVRVARLFRTIRLIRALHLVRALNTIFVAIIKAVRSLAWTIALMMLLMFIVGVFLTQLVTDLKVNNHLPQNSSSLLNFYGTLDRSILSLYMMISQGIQWRDGAQPLLDDVSPFILIVILFYITFTIFGLTNIVTSVFVESVIQAREESGRDALFHHVQKVFLGEDIQKMAGTVTCEEFREHMQDKEMQMYFKAIDLSPDDAHHIFTLLDVGEAGEIPVEDFLSGCMRLQGSAKAIDLAILTAETRNFNTQVMNELNKLRTELAALRRA